MIDKEAIYDERISPLVQQIIDICKEENIPFLMQFALKEGETREEDTYCMSAIYGLPGMMETPTFQKAIKALRGEPEFSAFMVKMVENRNTEVDEK